MKNNNKEGVLRAVAYARYSSDMQREESIDAQLSAIEKYADDHGMTIVHEYIDRAKSARNNKRPEFLQMIDDSGENKFDVILCHKLDRFSRNRYDSAIYKRKLMVNGVRLISVLEPLDGSPESGMLEAVLESMNEYYCKNLAREVSKGHLENAKKCKSAGGTPPLGFTINPRTKKLKIVEEEAEIIRLIFKMAASGDSIKKIVLELNKRCYKTKKGNAFTSSRLHDLLLNEKYRGCYIYNRAASADYNGKRNGHKNKSNDEIIKVENGCPRIISDEEFFMVQEQVHGRKQPEGHRLYKEDYLLTKKMYCGCCGGGYSGQRRKRGKEGTYWVFYKCNKKGATNGIVCKNPDVSCNYLENEVLRIIAGTVFSEKNVAVITKAYNGLLKKERKHNNEISRQKQRINSINEKIDSITELLIAKKSKSLFGKLDKLEEDKDILERELYNMELLKKPDSVSDAEISKVFMDIREQMMNGSLEDIKKVIHVCVERIIVYADEVEIQFNFLPNIKFPRLNSEAANARKQRKNPSVKNTDEFNFDNANESTYHVGGEGGS